VIFSRGRAYGTVLHTSSFVVCTECIVAKQCILEQKLLLTVYRKSYIWYQNEWPWPLFRGCLRSCQPLRHIRH